MNLVSQIDGLLAGTYGPTGPGAVGIVTRAGRTLFRKAYGLADLELAVPMLPEMVFGIGSITKVFTAVAVMLLAERGLLSYADPVRSHVAGCPASWSDITVDNLLAHTAGIPDLFTIPSYLRQLREDASPQQLLAMVSDQPLQFAPGHGAAYSNSGYVLLGLLVETITRKPLEPAVTGLIIDPLDLTNTYHTLRGEALVPGRVKGYQLGPGGAIHNAPYVSWSQAYGAGTMHSTADDLARFVRDLFTGKLLSPEALAHLTTPKRSSTGELSPYGYGTLFRFVEGHAPFVRVSGSSNGYEAYSLYLPGQDAYVAVLTNVTAHGRANPYFPGPLATQIAVWLDETLA
jgi:CubicO group peptidase (beta-lactamase class C family)